MAPDADAAKTVGSRPDPALPLTSDYLSVGDGHELYVETIGRPDGIPAVYLHGGPGSGCQPDHRRLFDPERFHAVLFDQRGAGRSRPKASLDHNTLPHLIADLELIREKLSIERWMLVGGSWGATLALAYAENYPQRVSGLVLRAVFLATQSELDGAFMEMLPRFYPELHEDFLGLLTPEERARPLQAYWKRILDPDPEVHAPAARAWYSTEFILSEHHPSRTRIDLAALHASKRLPVSPFVEAHYFQHGCFMAPGQLLAGAGGLAGIPGIIVQGRYDLLCPPSTSHALAKAWPDAELRVIEAAGHSLYDAGIRDAVTKAISDMIPRLDA